MNFANVSATMSHRLERHPRSRRPSYFETCTNTRDPIVSFMMRDERWQLLRRPSQERVTQESSLQRLVMRTGKEVHSLTYAELLKRAKALDAEIPQSPYLEALAARGSTLIDLHDALTEIFDLETPSDAQQFERVPPRILQINYAGRLIGRKLEEAFGWNPRGGFGIDTDIAQSAIALCSDAVKENTPPYI